MAENALAQLFAPQATPGAAPGAAKVEHPDKSAAKARLAAEEFESVYMSLMLSNMFTDISSDGPFGGGPGEKIFRTHLYEELGRIFARSGGIGIADSVHREILRLQEV